MSETTKIPVQSTNYTKKEFDELLAAMDSIVEMDQADLDPTLYNYHQVKKLLHHFNIPFTRGMKKPAMMAALRNHRQRTIQAQATATTALAPAPSTTNPVATDVDEATQLQIAAAQVNESNAEEELVDPAPDVELTKAVHGAEMEELDAKLAKLEEEMNEMWGELVNVSTASVEEFKANEFKEGMTNVNLRITQQALQLRSVAESLDERFPGETPLTSLLITPVEEDDGGGKPPAKRSKPPPSTKELYYGFEHKDGRRTFCSARKEAEDDRLRRNGFILRQYSYSQEEILQWMTHQQKEPPEQSSPVHLRGGGNMNSGGVGTSSLPKETADSQPTAQHQPTTLAASIAEAYLPGAAKRAELRRQLGMDDELGETTARALNFDGERDNDGIDEFLGTGDMPRASDYSRGDDENTVLHGNKHTEHGGMPTPSMPANPYNTGQTPLTDKYLGQCNDFYLHGVDGLTSSDDFTLEHYRKFHFPENLFSPIRYDFIKLIDDYETPYLDDKQIRNLPQLVNLDPETFVDWYTSMQDELMMITRVALLPFDAIKINYQYVGLCIPGVGERKFMEMGKILYRACSKTLPQEFDAVKHAFQNNSCRVKNGYRLLWDILVTALPAFCPYVKFPEPSWMMTRDVTTHSKRWILFFRFMSKSYRDYSSDTEQSLLFLRSIQEPALLSQIKSLEVSILNENEQVVPRLRGRAPLPTHLCIDALSKTLALTVQPLTNEFQYSPAANTTTMLQSTGMMHLPPFGYGNTTGYHHSMPHYGSTLPYNHFNNGHVMQGNTPVMNWTERHRGTPRNDSNGSNNRRPSGGRARGSGKKTPRDTTKPKVICQACFVPGHEAVMCWTLARALLAHDFIKTVVDRNILREVQNNYKKRFQPPEHPRANRMCAESLWTYCSDNHVTPEQVCHQMDWKGLAESRNDSDGDEDGDSTVDGRDSEGDEEV